MPIILYGACKINWRDKQAHEIMEKEWMGKEDSHSWSHQFMGQNANLVVQPGLQQKRNSHVLFLGHLVGNMSFVSSNHLYIKKVCILVRYSLKLDN